MEAVKECFCMSKDAGFKVRGQLQHTTISTGGTGGIRRCCWAANACRCRADLGLCHLNALMF